ncbi:MAG: site-specific integrase [Desulfurellales bacterium]|nr:MAG: site-specific integrase [Desulfurellales bacterium]
MTNELATVQQTAIVTFADNASRNPALVYLASLSESSRRPMKQSLDVIASIVSSGTVDALTLPWGQLRFEHTQAIRSKLAESYSAATANRHLSALRGVLKDSWRLGYMSAEEYQRAIDLKPVKGEKASQAEKGRHLKTGEFNALLNNCLDGSISGARDACMIIFAYTCGLRRAELAALQIADIDTDNCTLTVKHGKGGKERVIPMVDSTCDVLADWLVKRGNQPGELFTRVLKGDNLTAKGLTEQAIYTIFAERASAAGVKEFTPHDMRRSFAGDLLDSGADISTVAKLMGHSSVSTTARYDRRDAKAKRKAVQALHVSYTKQF